MSPTHRCSYTLLVLTNCTARLPTRTQVMSTLVLSSYRGYKLLTGILTTWPTSASSVDSLVDHIMYALLTRFHNHILRKLYSPHLSALLSSALLNVSIHHLHYTLADARRHPLKIKPLAWTTAVIPFTITLPFRNLAPKPAGPTILKGALLYSSALSPTPSHNVAFIIDLSFQAVMKDGK